MLAPLPIDPRLPEIVERLHAASGLVLTAEPGAGKTTRVPWAVLEAGLSGDREIVVLQPRRLAARLAARRVAAERGERLGERVGYQVRFEEIAGPRTRLRFVTEGVLTRRLLSEPLLDKVGLVVLDEFHERHLDGDLCLALLRRLQQGRRPDLKIVVMSATLDPGPVATFLGDVPSLDVEGRRFEVSIEHAPLPDQRPLETQVASAVRRLADEGLDGDVLVFLPGAAEIRKAQTACEAIAQRENLLLVALHGDLPAAEQDRAVSPADRRKVIFSTNVAETSVTIEGVVAVVDSGLARVAGHSAWSGLPTLKVARVSKASAVQRAGRAGRVRAGRCLRLYTRHDFDTRHEYEAPEIRRLDLAETSLALHGSGVADLSGFGWFEDPPAAALEAAETLLARLGAIDAQGRPTELGRRMLQLAVHPRQARVLLEAESRGRGADGCVIAALLGEREIRLEARGAAFGPYAKQARVSGPSDVLESLEVFRQAQRKELAPAALRSLGLDMGAVQAVERVQRSLTRSLRRVETRPDPDPDRPLLIALLAGYPDRVARRRSTDGAALVLCGGAGMARLAETSVVRDAPFLVAIDAEERTTGARGGTTVRVASRVEPEWLLDLFSDRVREVTEVSWNASAERVDGFSRLLYEDLVIEESRLARFDNEQTAALLAQEALSRGPRAFAEEGAIDQLLARVKLVSEASPKDGFPVLTEEDVRGALTSLCEGRRSFAELREASLVEALLSRLTGVQRASLDRLAPAHVKLPGGRQLLIHYEPDRAPWAESRLQDFFGLATGPAVVNGRVFVVLHLLAPNKRPVQVTTDLAGFWDRHYPALRRELCRKYPKHAWPEDPRTAKPPPPGKLR
ncbi:MAG: ATP-dependent helicase HrpB [Deltaproteobacteria bacterium]|nr:ATP-dependent helicase HrpB [Deltaproteobacteria bacterium]